MNSTDLRFYSSKDASEVFLELVLCSLYSPKKYKTGELKPLVKAVRYGSVTHDMFCPYCQREAIFKAATHKSAVELNAKQNAIDNRISISGKDEKFSNPPLDWTSEFTLTMLCARQNHIASYYFVSSLESLISEDQDRWSDFEWTITKVGQFPSVVDFHRGDFQRFDSILTKDQIRDMRKAVETTAHGFNVAACVYYRRVFEGLISTAKKEHLNKIQMSEWAEYDKAKTEERIIMLKEELPSFMNTHRQLYTILSKGVHELTEKECGLELPILRQAIELILEEQLITKERKNNAARIANLVQQSVDRNKSRAA